MAQNNKLVKKFLEQEEDLFTQNNKEREQNMIPELQKDENTKDLLKKITKYVGAQGKEIDFWYQWNEDRELLEFESRDISYDQLPAIRAAFGDVEIRSGHGRFIHQTFTDTDDGHYELEIGYALSSYDGQIDSWVGIGTAIFHEASMKWEFNSNKIPDWR